MLVMNQLNGFGARNVISATSSFTYNGFTYVTTGTATSVTASGVDIGAADANRVVVCMAGLYTSSGRSITGITIGGSAATVLASGSGAYRTFLAYRTVASGTTANVVITMSGSSLSHRLYMVTYSLYGVTAAAKETGYKSSGTDYPSVAFASGDIGLFFDYPGALQTWTNAAEDYDDGDVSSAHVNTPGTVVVSNIYSSATYGVYGVFSQA